jgi:hypothetical protein
MHALLAFNHRDTEAQSGKAGTKMFLRKKTKAFRIPGRGKGFTTDITDKIPLDERRSGNGCSKGMRCSRRVQQRPQRELN